MKVTASIKKPSDKSYNIKGKTLEDVMTALDKRSFWGHYDYAIKSSYKKNKSGKVDTIKITLTCSITMPKWTGYGKATKAEKKSWDDMYGKLKKHEMNHHAHTLEQIAIWAASMDKLGDLDVKEVTKEFNAFMTAVQKAQDDYDKKTDHGKREGVILKAA